MSVTSACARCQTPLDTGARFCQVCGLSVSGEQTAPLPTLLQVLRQATLGEYEVLREIGQGGMATVFLAHEIALDRKVAIKVMSPQFVHGADMIERFKREARTAASLNHPHIIPIYAVRESQHVLYFVMKYIQGRSVDAILRDVGPLPFPMVRSILSDIGSALDYAHRQGVVHRDVKPGNIMIDEEGFAVITDFGIARAAQSDSLTRSGTTVGTPSYLSPEACSGETVGPGADQYSLGIVGYEMVTGQLPFTAESSLGMMYAQVHSPPRPSDQLRPDCPDDLRDAIMRMLEKAPADRFPTLKEAVHALNGGRTPSRITLERPDGGDDNVRSHIGLLAVPRPGRPVGEMRKTPASPAPLSRIPPNTKVVARQRRVQLGQVVIGLFLAALGAGVVLVTLRDRLESAFIPDSATPGSAADTKTDSVLLVTRGAANYAREHALAATVPASALAPGDSLQALADSLAAQGHKADAALLLQRAATFYSSAEGAKKGDAQQRAEPAPPKATPPRTVATAPRQEASASDHPASGGSASRAAPGPALSDSAAIAQFYGELEKAVQSRQLNEVQRLLPNMSDNEARDWRDFFVDEDIRSLEAHYTVQNVTRQGEVVYARVREEVTVHRVDGKSSKKRDDVLWTQLTNGPQGWRQIRAAKAPK
ncbi:MAG TPA: protein kinase [Gemmatimonadales bacterium]|nr:protein kinase [Gemmatimonadales bacterium]